MPANDLHGVPITIVGAGAIGGTVGAFLSDAGYDVTLVDVDAAHVAAINERGLRITGLRGDRVFHPRAIRGDELRGPLGVTILCVKGHFTDGAMQQIGPLLAPDGYVLSLQNGLNEKVIARHVGAAADGRRVRPLRRGLDGAGPDPTRHRADDLHRRTGRRASRRAPKRCATCSPTSCPPR